MAKVTDKNGNLVKDGYYIMLDSDGDSPIYHYKSSIDDGKGFLVCLRGNTVYPIKENLMANESMDISGTEFFEQYASNEYLSLGDDLFTLQLIPNAKDGLDTKSAQAIKEALVEEDKTERGIELFLESHILALRKQNIKPHLIEAYMKLMVDMTTQRVNRKIKLKNELIAEIEEVLEVSGDQITLEEAKKIAEILGITSPPTDSE